MGVWIETTLDKQDKNHNLVTPCMGVWIETEVTIRDIDVINVTPCMGVWIETFGQCQKKWGTGRHTLYGCVD